MLRGRTGLRLRTWVHITALPLITGELLSPLLHFSVLSVSLWKPAHSFTAFLDSWDKWCSHPSWFSIYEIVGFFISHLSILLTKEERGGACPRPCITWRIHSHLGGSATLTHQCFNKDKGGENRDHINPFEKRPWSLLIDSRKFHESPAQPAALTM